MPTLTGHRFDTDVPVGAVVVLRDTHDDDVHRGVVVESPLEGSNYLTVLTDELRDGDGGMRPHLRTITVGRHAYECTPGGHRFAIVTLEGAAAGPVRESLARARADLADAAARYEAQCRDETVAELAEARAGLHAARAERDALDAHIRALSAHCDALLARLATTVVSGRAR